LVTFFFRRSEISCVAIMKRSYTREKY